MRARIYEFLRFCVVGFIGYAVDAGLLELFVRLGAPPSLGRVFSIACAMQVTYLLHGAFTYRGHGGYSRRSWVRFIGTNAVGAGINYGVFLLVLYSAFFADPLAQRQLALLCGTAVALGFNHWANKRFAFKTGAPL